MEDEVFKTEAVPAENEEELRDGGEGMRFPPRSRVRSLFLPRWTRSPSLGTCNCPIFVSRRFQSAEVPLTNHKH